MLRTLPRLRRSILRAAAVLAAGSLALSACGSSDSSESSGSAKGLTTVTLAMDYLPNPAHNGLAYAMQNGLFEKQGIEVKLLPFSSTAAETVVSSGKADVGISGNIGGASLAFAAGTKAKAIFNMVPKQQAVLSVLKSSGIERPADLAGKTYGGYGTAPEVALVDGMIADDGGTGKSKQIVLSVGSTEALKAKQVDVAAMYPDQLFQFEQEKVETINWNPSDYGIPNSGGALVIGADTWLDKNPELAKKFVAVLQEGYQAAVDDTEAANAALEKQFNDLNPELVAFVGKYNAEKLMVNEAGPVGTLDPQTWQTYVDWMIDNGLMVDAAGKSLKTFDVTPYVTNDFLPAS